MSQQDRPLQSRPAWHVPLLLFVLTVGSVFWAGIPYTFLEAGLTAATLGPALLAAASFAVPLMSILLAHEFGHYIAARLHGIPASLPYFLPLPMLSPFGTLGAIILVSERVRRRNALLDFGAAGPLAGLAVAIPVMVVGLHLSKVEPLPTDAWVQEGQSLLYWALKHSVFGTIPAGYDVSLHPTAFAAWVGFLVTFFNLLPWSQLDGGHVAYALLGERQNRLSRSFFLVPLVLAAYNAIAFGIPVFVEKTGLSAWTALMAVSPWLVMFGIFVFIRSRAGGEHPPTDPLPPLSPVRKAVGIFTLSFYVLLFMPTPLVVYEYEPSAAASSPHALAGGAMNDSGLDGEAAAKLLR